MGVCYILLFHYYIISFLYNFYIIIIIYFIFSLFCKYYDKLYCTASLYLKFFSFFNSK